MGEDLLYVASQPYDLPADIPHMAIRLGIERGVFERRPVYQRDNSSQTQRLRKMQLPVPLPGAITPLTRSALEGLLDDAVAQARRFAQPEPYSSARRYEEYKP